MREYLIDFGTMVIEAKDENEAYNKAKKLINSGEEFPTIDTVIDNGEVE